MADLELWYDAPAREWTEALPIGNGRLGAMIFGGAERERLQLNEDTLWTGGPYSQVNPEARPHLDEVRSLIFAGRLCRGGGACQPPPHGASAEADVLSAGGRSLDRSGHRRERRRLPQVPRPRNGNRRDRFSSRRDEVHTRGDRQSRRRRDRRPPDRRPAGERVLHAIAYLGAAGRTGGDGREHDRLGAGRIATARVSPAG